MKKKLKRFGAAFMAAAILATLGLAGTTQEVQATYKNMGTICKAHSRAKCNQCL